MRSGHSNRSLVETPCVRQCCLDSNDVCLGCHRSLDEILAWHSMNDQQKVALIEILQQRAIACKNR
ncbi:DUF1289 domain-containing protein [Shewanella inventionis]|uniref:DUF1289 domain-containing protein n=1 Tax=Shewanella inventionis TaxID=1738770 RepID=A0ABQ1JR88_9GAMM|nr:DUF1289 domain-containing protein [Shewanella inventionis]MCL1159440.1 DUF1289 domain-containing protein [Shewanella inventionis]UAL41472.1 DUF1289 domain-containing protein [Shewanella inventionis]GGB73399.1 DUF1289 domain-containing protein [Shewanella inventionis]